MSAVLTLIDVSDMDQDEEGTPIHIGQGQYVAVDAVWTAASSAPTGTLKWQYSKDYVPARASSATWRDLENGSFTTSPAGSAGSTAEVFEDLVGWVRPYYAQSSGGTSESLTVTAEVGHRR